MFGRRRNAGGRDRDLVTKAEAGLAMTAGEIAGDDPGGAVGPWDSAQPHSQMLRSDLGSLRVPMVEGADIHLVFSEQHGSWVSVRYELSELQLQAYAASRRASIWDEVRTEIAAEIGTSLTAAGATTAEREGPFGTELLAHVPVEPGQPAAGLRPVRFVGVDGPRWFLRGLFVGDAADDPVAAAPLEAVFREVVVVRGEHPMPPRDLLELRPPAEAMAALQEQQRVLQEQQQAQPPGEQQGRFATPLNPFERGPEFTETR